MSAFGYPDVACVGKLSSTLRGLKPKGRSRQLSSSRGRGRKTLLHSKRIETFASRSRSSSSFLKVGKLSSTLRGLKPRTAFSGSISRILVGKLSSTLRGLKLCQHIREGNHKDKVGKLSSTLRGLKPGREITDATTVSLMSENSPPL